MADPYAAFELVEDASDNADPYAQFEFVSGPEGAEMVPSAPRGAGKAYEPGGMRMQQSQEEPSNWTGTQIEADIRQGITGPISDWVYGDDLGGSVYDRVTDTAAFAGSLPVRMATQGKKGLADVLPYIPFGNYIADDVRRAEAGFIDRNRNALTAAQNVGTSAGFLPTYSTMGRIPPSPRVPNARTTYEVRRGTPDDLNVVDQGNRARAAQYAEDAGIAPHIGIQGGQSTRQIGAVAHEQPLVGEPLRQSTRNTLQGMHDKSAELAGRYGSSNMDGAGRIATGGVERFKTAPAQSTVGQTIEGLADTELASVAQRGPRETSLPTAAAAQYEQAYRSIPEDMRHGRTVGGQSRVIGGAPDTTLEVHRQIGRNQGMINRAQAERDAKLSYDPKNPAFADPSLPTATTSTELLRGRGTSFPAMAVPSVGNPLVNSAVQNIATGKWRGTFADMRNLRSQLRRQLSSKADNEANTLSRSDMQNLSHSLERDFYHMLTRNADEYRQRGDIVTANNFDKAVLQFQLADQVYAKGKRSLEKLKVFQGDKITAERAGNVIYRAAQAGGRGDLELITTMRGVLRRAEWDEIAGGVMRKMGEVPGGTSGPQGLAQFSPSRFATQWNNMSVRARVAFFGGRGRRGDIRELNEFANLATQFREFERLANTSRSGVHNITAGLVFGGAGVASFQAAPMSTLAAATVAYGATALLGNTRFLSWLNRGRRMEAAALRGNVRAQRNLMDHQRRFRQIVTQDPAILQTLNQAGMLGDSDDNQR